MTFSSVNIANPITSPIVSITNVKWDLPATEVNAKEPSSLCYLNPPQQRGFLQIKAFENVRVYLDITSSIPDLPKPNGTKACKKSTRNQTPYGLKEAFMIFIYFLKCFKPSSKSSKSFMTV